MTSGLTRILNVWKMFSHSTHGSTWELVAEPEIRFLRHTLPMSMAKRRMEERVTCDDLELISVGAGTMLGGMEGWMVSGGERGAGGGTSAVWWCVD